jgi:X-X-X-Leu-X-X-Gly heptad repeat protein
MATGSATMATGSATMATGSATMATGREPPPQVELSATAPV